MDALPPFARAEDRLRNLYQLGLDSHAARVLVIGTPADAALAFGMPDAGLDVTVGGAASPGPGHERGAFDAVAFPGSLFRGRRDAGATALLHRAQSALRPGGVLLGHAERALSCARARGAIAFLPWSALHASLGTGPLQRALLRSGFVDAECYDVVPSITDPLALVPGQGAAAASYFARLARRHVGCRTQPARWLRVAVARLGWTGCMLPHMFFWARKPC